MGWSDAICPLISILVNNSLRFSPSFLLTRSNLSLSGTPCQLWIWVIELNVWMIHTFYVKNIVDTCLL